MPQYELMYLLGSHVADTDVPAISEQIKKFIADLGGNDIREQQLGKKKLAYPIKRTRNGHYVVVNFEMDSRKVNDLDAKIRTQDSTIIRYILISLEEFLERSAKDAAIQAKMPKRQIPDEEQPAVKAEPAPVSAPAAEPVIAAEETPAAKPAKKSAPVIELDQEELDKKIEEALSEDLTK